MKKLKPKNSDTAPTEIDAGAMTEEEREVLEDDGQSYQEEHQKVSSKKMEQVVGILTEEFNLKDKGFELVGYSDKGNKIVATVSNNDYEATFTVKSQDTIMRLNLQEGEF